MLLEVSGLEVRYGPVVAVKGINLRVAEGTIVALLGPNGAGKSSTVRAISGMMPVRGSIRFNGRELRGLKEPAIVRLGLIQVPEGRQIFPEFTVAENLAIGAFARKDRRAVRDDEERVLAYFPRLRERYRQQAGTLSGGEQQMLAVARGLMARPRLLMLDEPSLGLAPNLVRDLFDILAAINRDGTSILLVEQNARMALRIAHYAYLLDLGEIKYSGPAGGLLEQDLWRSYVAEPAAP